MRIIIGFLSLVYIVLHLLFAESLDLVNILMDWKLQIAFASLYFSILIKQWREVLFGVKFLLAIVGFDFRKQNKSDFQ